MFKAIVGCLIININLINKKRKYLLINNDSRIYPPPCSKARPWRVWAQVIKNRTLDHLLSRSKSDLRF